MPDILIRGIEMPKSCCECYGVLTIASGCAGKRVKYGDPYAFTMDDTKERAPDCPLVIAIAPVIVPANNKT